MKKCVKFKSLVKRQNIFSLLLIFVVLTVFYFPLFENINSPVDNSDYQQYYYQMGLLKKICLEYGQFPLRNPFLAGGYPIPGNLRTFILNPLNIFTLLSGEVAGIRLSTFLLIMFCASGMFYLTRIVLKYNYAGSIFSTLTFMLSGWGVFHIVGGDYEKLYFYLLPWLIAFFIRAKANRRFVVLASLMLGLVLVEGGLIIIPVALFLFIYAFLQSSIVFKNKRWKIDISFLGNLLLIFLFAGLLYAVKIIPMLNLIKMNAVDYIHFPGEHSYALASSLSKTSGHALNFTSLQNLLLNKEYAGYGKFNLGIIPIIFFLLSGLIFFRKNWRYLLTLSIFVVLSFGANSPIDLFKPLWHMHPFVHGIWKLDKYFSFPMLFLISLIGGKLFLIPERINRFKIPLKLILIIIALIGIINMFAENKKGLVFSYKEIPEIKKVDSFFQVRVKKYKVCGPFDVDAPDEKFTRFYWFSMLQGFGVVNNILGSAALPLEERIIPKYFVDNKYYDEIKQSADSNPMKHQKINPSYKGEVFFNKVDNYARFEYFSPNKLKVFVHMVDSPDILVINQRYDTGWRCSIGKLKNWRGLLGIELEEKGDYVIQLKYMPKDFLSGLIISLLTLIGIIIYWKKCKR